MSENSMIEKWWRIYRETVVHPEAGQTQLYETRKAFFGGFISCLKILYDLGKKDCPEELGAEVLNALQAEARQFVDEMKAKVPDVIAAKVEPV